MKHRTAGLLVFMCAVALSGWDAVPELRAQAGPRMSADAEQRRAERERTADTLAALDLRPGAMVADIGAGTGFHTARLSKLVGPEGRVFAVDIAPGALLALHARVEEEGLDNVEVIEGAVDDPRLPEGALDAALIVNAYHEMEAYEAILARVRAALKPGGRLVIVEPLSESRRAASREVQVRNHEIASSFVVAEARAAEYDVVGLEDPFVRSRLPLWMVVLARGQGAADAPSPVATPARDQVRALASADVPRITPAELAALQARGPVVLLDVRDEAMFARGRIPGARLATMSALRDVVAEVRGSDVPIVTYCSCPQEESSGRAVLYLEKHGIAGGRALLGGYEAWIAERRSVETGR